MSSAPLSDQPRIEVLDGFRCLAVMAVLAYHYFYCYGVVVQIDPAYPTWYFFAFGYFGVYLFFMISGFVIYRSLEQTKNFKEFIGKRYIRLVPTLLLGSIFTFLLVYWWNASTGRMETFGTRPPADFLFSLTFIHPDFWNFLWGRSDIKFMDGAYWTLWAEVVFYVFVSIIYFSSRKENFLRNWFILVFVLNILNFMLPATSIYSRAFVLMSIRNWTYFSAGILFYSLWTNRNPSVVIWLMFSILFVYEIYLINSNGVRLLFPLVVGMWIVFLRKPSWLRILLWRPIQIIGLISYPLYVLHFYAGLVITEKLRVLTNHAVPIPVLLTLVLAVFILLAYFVFAFFEKPVTRTLKEKLLHAART